MVLGEVRGVLWPAMKAHEIDYGEGMIEHSSIDQVETYFALITISLLAIAAGPLRRELGSYWRNLPHPRMAEERPLTIKERMAAFSKAAGGNNTPVTVNSYRAKGSSSASSKPGGSCGPSWCCTSAPNLSPPWSMFSHLVHAVEPSRDPRRP